MYHLFQIIANNGYLKYLLYVMEFSFLVCPSGHRQSLRQQELDRSFTTSQKTLTTTRFDFKSLLNCRVYKENVYISIFDFLSSLKQQPGLISRLLNCRIYNNNRFTFQFFDLSSSIKQVYSLQLLNCHLHKNSNRFYVFL
jgi:hypothetical protein